MLKLVLPVIFPSWRFFSSIGPSPRIHIAFLHHESDTPTQWQEFRPKPLNISCAKMLFRLFHNPQWNETLYINTCAERLFEGYSDMREREIMRRILAAVNSGEVEVAEDSTYVIYRISAVMREGLVVNQQVTFVSTPAFLKGAE